MSREDLDSAEKIICIVHRGDWHSFPENSAEAVKAGCEYGFVSVDVKLTKDGKAVLLADDTTDRMVVDADGKTVSG
ncbi:MAG: glycerophosphodiester phosphodiesterase family protein, partial [Acutalibacteraceae bacterium]|nr:glycerophosphodiester phosphodiesterase family protein [Acutalibacteraceae bacterium]